jgi:hypothetical protein
MFRPIAAAAIALALAGPALAQDERAFPYGSVTGWTVEALRDSAGFTGCAGRSEQGPGRLAIGWSLGSWYIRVPGPRAQGFRAGVIRLDMGDRIDLQYDFAPDMTATATVADGIVPRLAAAAMLRTRINNVDPVDWSLTGSRAMIELVTECVTRDGKPPG